jgi:hypothetical protein
MSDIIRGAEQTVVIAQNLEETVLRPDMSADDQALRGWGERVWTLPEVLLSKGRTVIAVINNGKPRSIDKVQLARRAWPDAGESRQLVEHYTSLPLSRLEFVSVAIRSLMNRELHELHKGDRSYALMGLLRVKPTIDSTDSSFQAFAR